MKYLVLRPRSLLGFALSHPDGYNLPPPVLSFVGKLSQWFNIFSKLETKGS